MNIAIDGRILDWKYSGIARYTNLLLSAEALKGAKIYSPKKVLFNPFRRRELYEQIFLPIQLLKDKIDLFIQPYNFGIPILFGGKSILIVFDIIPLLFKDYFYYARFKSWAKWNYLTNTRIAVSRATKIICDSKSAREDLINYFPKIDKTKVDYIYYGFEAPDINLAFDFKKFCREKNISSEYILVNAGLEPRKNIHLLIKAYADLQKSRQKLPLLVITGYNKYYFEILKKIAVAKKIEKNVIFTDSITEDEKNALLQNAILVVNPSQYEGFGIPIVEAAFYKKPIIASNIPAFKEVGESYPIYFENNNKEDLIDKLRLFFETQKMEEEKVRQKGQEVVERFSVKKMLEKWNEAIGTI